MASRRRAQRAGPAGVTNEAGQLWSPASGWVSDAAEAELLDSIKAIAMPEGGRLVGVAFINHYACNCGATWDDERTCACDDECPQCGTDISPEDSEESYHEIAEPELHHLPETGNMVVVDAKAQHRADYVEAAQRAAEARGWRQEGDVIFDSNVFESWKAALSWSGEDGRDERKNPLWCLHLDRRDRGRGDRDRGLRRRPYRRRIWWPPLKKRRCP